MKEGIIIKKKLFGFFSEYSWTQALCKMYKNFANEETKKKESKVYQCTVNLHPKKFISYYY